MANKIEKFKGHFLFIKIKKFSFLKIVKIKTIKESVYIFTLSLNKLQTFLLILY